jgi:hypothetical protein
MSWTAGWVTLTCGDPALAITVRLGEDSPRLTGGLGGWTTVGRPRDVGMTVWEGVEPYQLALSLMFDGYAAQRSQERALRALSRVARGDRESSPGVLHIDGIPLPADDWVIESIEFGDAITRDGGDRLRQPLSLTLREYVPPQYLRRRKSPSSSSSKTVVVRSIKGDTPAKIAKRRKVKSWTVIRDLNRKLVKKANQSLKPGTKIRVPAAKKTAKSGGKDKRKR